MRPFSLAAGAAVFLLTVLASAEPAKSAPEAVLGTDDLRAILAELRQIRTLLERGGAPQQPAAGQPGMPQPAERAAFAIDTGRMLGSPDAPVTIVEFADAQCGFCRQFHANAFREIRKKYIDTGKVRFVSRDLPLDATSPSLRAAEAFHCAADQNRFWELRDAVLSGTPRVTEESVRAAAVKTGLDAAKFDTCMSSGRHIAAIQKDIDEAARLKIAGTPTFVIGRTTAEGVDGVTLVGALPLSAFEAKILAAGPTAAVKPEGVKP